jgi:hypothetical protein
VLFLLVSKLLVPGATLCGASGFFVPHIGPSLGKFPDKLRNGAHGIRSLCSSLQNSLRGSGLPRIVLLRGECIKARHAEMRSVLEQRLKTTALHGV